MFEGVGEGGSGGGGGVRTHLRRSFNQGRPCI